MYALHRILCAIIIVFNIVYRVAAEGAALGGRCSQNGLPGVCQRRSECASASQLPIEFRMISPCKDGGAETVVCCLDHRVTPVAELPITEPVLDPSLESLCANVSEELTTEKTGWTAWDKCIEYQKQLIYPCKRSNTIMRQYSRGNYCKHSADPIIVGGRASATDEFPHMVQLGAQVFDYVMWHCSGTLLSEWFILTAAHCTSTPGSNNEPYRVSHAAVGLLQNQDQKQTIPDGFQVYSIPLDGIIKHPHWVLNLKQRPPKKTNDIALLKTEKRIVLSHAAVPACLDIFGGDTNYATATGWGSTETKTSSYILQKVTLNRFSDEVCWNRTRRARTGPFNTTSQLCYGHYTERADTCKGDSGGPLTIHNPKVNCMYSIIGITSYATSSTGCGQPGQPGIYTKVSQYVPWIESVVWPNGNGTSEHI